MAAPTWFGRAPLHAAAISCCVLPFAKASTWSLRVDEVRLPTAGCSALVRRRLGRGAAAAFVAAVGVLAVAGFLDGGAFLLRARAPPTAPPLPRWPVSLSRCASTPA